VPASGYLNSYPQIQSYVLQIFEDAMFVARDTNVMANLVTVFNDRTNDATRTNSLYGTATMQSVADTDDLASQAFTPATYKSLTPAEIAAQVFLTDRRIDNDIFGARNDASVELGIAMAQQMELDMIGDIASLTGGTVGGAGTVLTWGHIFAADAILRQANAPGRYSVVLSPLQWFSLGTAPSILGAARNAEAFQDRVQSEGITPRSVFSLGNYDIYLTSNIGAGTAAVGGMFARPALALDSRRAPRLEPERDASRRGWELNLSAVYAHGVWRPEWGVQIVGAGTVPTGA
jgi:hypothetical protein